MYRVLLCVGLLCICVVHEISCSLWRAANMRRFCCGPPHSGNTNPVSVFHSSEKCHTHLVSFITHHGLFVLYIVEIFNCKKCHIHMVYKYLRIVYQTSPGSEPTQSRYTLLLFLPGNFFIITSIILLLILLNLTFVSYIFYINKWLKYLIIMWHQ